MAVKNFMSMINPEENVKGSYDCIKVDFIYDSPRKTLGQL